MSEKFRNKYRIPSSRWQQWDYRSEGIYFITICTKNRIHYFGEIENGKMILNELGEKVQEEWIKSIEIRPDMHLELGEFIVMPNHFHAVIIIGENKYNTKIGMETVTYLRQTNKKINLVRNQKIWHPLSGDLNLQ